MGTVLLDGTKPKPSEIRPEKPWSRVIRDDQDVEGSQTSARRLEVQGLSIQPFQWFGSAEGWAGIENCGYYQISQPASHSGQHEIHCKRIDFVRIFTSLSPPVSEILELWTSTRNVFTRNPSHERTARPTSESSFQTPARATKSDPRSGYSAISVQCTVQEQNTSLRKRLGSSSDMVTQFESTETWYLEINDGVRFNLSPSSMTLGLMLSEIADQTSAQAGLPSLSTREDRQVAYHKAAQFWARDGTKSSVLSPRDMLANLFEILD